MRLSRLLYLNGALWTLLSGLLSGQQTDNASEPALIPPVIVSATCDTAVVKKVPLTVAAKPIPDDFAAGPLENELAKERRIIPKVTVKVTNAASPWELEVSLEQLIPFGESKVPLLYKGRKVAVLQFSKVGLVLADPPDGGFTVRQPSPLTLILKNQTGDKYEEVRVRLRFLDLDVCKATADRGEQKANGNAADQGAQKGESDWWDTIKGLIPGSKVEKSKSDCQNMSEWTKFRVDKYASMTLRIKPEDKWFIDPKTEFARPAKRKGMLTLQFIDTVTTSVHEQNLPLEVQFDPGDGSVFWSVLRVVKYLLLGAVIALCLRVVIPNYRRKKALREQLQEVAKATRGISGEVPSVLRVLLRVERLTLDQIRKSRWVAGPNYPDAALRVEQGLVTLKRRVELTRRLDTALSRMAIFEQGSVPPTRLNTIEKHLTMACEALKREQPLEQDWVFIQEKLEAADKYLGEPSQEERDAFDASLGQRWKAIAAFFGLTRAALIVPDRLTAMKKCFPVEQGLPEVGDPDGSQWVKGIGAARADLQLSSLEILRDYVFLAPSGDLSGKWQNAQDRLAERLATPALETLTAARRILDELSEGVDATELTEALCANRAVIEFDPQSVEPNEKVRMRVRFREERLQTAAARHSIKCEWEFCDQKRPGWWTRLRNRLSPIPTKSPEAAVPDAAAVAAPVAVPDAAAGAAAGAAPAAAPGAAPRAKQKELGWEIYHYFESDVQLSDITVQFYTEGKVVTKAGGEAHVQRQKIRPEERNRTSQEWWERFRQVVPEALQLFAALLVPIAALAVSQAGEGATGHWWELAGIGFGSETIRNILSGAPPTTTTAAEPPT